MNMFKLSDIKAGYLLVVTDEYGCYNMTVIHNDEGSLGCCCREKGRYWPLSRFGEELDYLGTKVLLIYGRTSNSRLMSNETVGRKLLWKRSEPICLTHKEIEERLGFKFEYVEEEA